MKKHKGTLILIAVIAVLLLLVVVSIAARPQGGTLFWLVRGAAMLGYGLAFLAILSSAYMRELYKLLGKPFLVAHHTLSIASLPLIALHPTLLAIGFGSASVYVPIVSSWASFWPNGGRVAIYLFAIGLIGAGLRKRWRSGWRVLHIFNYVAFLLVTVHAVMIGTDLSHPILRFVPLAMALAVTAVFVKKRIDIGRRKKKRASR